MYARLVDRPRLAELGGFRLCVSGSAPLAPELWERVRTASGVEVLERYGMTETVMLCTNPVTGRTGSRLGRAAAARGRAAARRRGRGRGARADRLRRLLGAARGDRGRRSPTTGGSAPATSVRGATTALRLVGRTSELVITGGYNVYPREVEDAVRAHPGVADVAVVGVPDADVGRAVVGVRRAGRPDVTRHGRGARRRMRRAGLAPYKRPRRWVTVDALPRNAMGKVRAPTCVAQVSPRRTPVSGRKVTLYLRQSGDRHPHQVGG